VSGTAEERLWAAVTEPGRRRLLDVLVERGEATPTALAEVLPYTRQAVSKHLVVLQEAGLVTPRRDGRQVRYAVRADQLEAAARVMVETANRWSVRLRAIKRVAEELHGAGTTGPPDHPGRTNE